jgi:arginine/lysine/ornithine decarboxylase
MIHIGKLLNSYLEKKRISRAALARKMDINLINLMKMEKKEHLNTSRLLEISTILQHNFFMDIAQALPTNFTNNQDIFEEKNLEIEKLKKEIEKLTIERDVLLRING